VSVHEQRVGWRRVAARRRISTAADGAVPMMWVMWTGQVNEARGGSGTGSRTRLAAERLSRGEAARTA